MMKSVFLHLNLYDSASFRFVLMETFAMADDTFQFAIDSPIAPAQACFAVTPTDLADLPRVTKALYVGQGGDIALVPARGDSHVTFRNVPTGCILDVRVRAIRATGTTASDLVGLA